MILFYSPGTCSLAEVILLQWLEEPHRLCRVTRDERKGPVYREVVNELGQVPVLEHDGELLTENAAILLFLADRQPDAKLVPEPLSADRYRLYRWLSWLDSGYHAAHAPMFAPQRFLADESQHAAIRARALENIAEQVAILDRHLDGREHVLFDRKNALDGYVFAMARWCEEKLDYATRFPNVKRFLDRMREDTGVQTALGIEAGEVTEGGALQGHVTFDDFVRDARAS